MEITEFISQFVNNLSTQGVRPGGVLMVHSSLRAFRYVPGGPETIIRGLLETLGKDGTLLMPALTYETVTPQNPVFNLQRTPSCVGAIPEYFRLRPGTRRSLHPTHSVCAFGSLTEQLLAPHTKDTTPCGPNSPFRRLPEFGGQILMLGCGLEPNTSIHAIEELVEPPYLYDQPITYTLTDKYGHTFKKEYLPHNFNGWRQRYERVSDIMTAPDLRRGKVLEAQFDLIEASALWATSLRSLKTNPLFFIDKINQTNLNGASRNVGEFDL